MTDKPVGIHAQLRMSHPGFQLDVELTLPGRGLCPVRPFRLGQNQLSA